VRLPFGPFLSLAAIEVLIFHDLVKQYISFFL